MNRNDFTGFVTGGRIPASSEITDVIEMTAMFPWFHSAHLVILKSLLENSDVRFDSQLHKSALFVADRAALYNYLYLVPAAKQEKEENTNTPAPPASEVVSQVRETLISDEVVTRSREELMAEIEARLRDLSAAAETLTSTGQDEESYVEPEAGSGENDLAILEIDNSSTGVMMSDEVLRDDPGDVNDDLLELESDETFSDVAGTEVLAGDQNMSGSDFNAISDDYVINIEEIGHSEDEADQKLSQTDLIDRFIQSNPRMERLTPGDNAPVLDLSEPSAEEKESFITETLAKIYVNQGFYSKAINIYEKLTLQYPEKSAYFASRIEKIKDLIK